LAPDVTAGTGGVGVVTLLIISQITGAKAMKQQPHDASLQPFLKALHPYCLKQFPTPDIVPLPLPCVKIAAYIQLDKELIPA
jgi:hypothetical protein